MNLLKSFAIFFFDILDLFHQKKIINYLKKEENEISNMIDIGCHKGKYFDLFSRYYGIEKAILIEPQIKYFHYLRKKYRKKKNIKVFNYAVSDKNGYKNFYINHHDLTSSLNTINQKNSFLKIKSKIFGLKTEDMIRTKLKVKVQKLDFLIEKLKIRKFDLIKIDTEGHELEVLQGGRKFIKKFKIILIEFRHDDIFKNYNSKKIHKFIINNNFLLKKKFKFPFTTWEDRIYIKK